MAEMETKRLAHKKGATRITKKSTRVDLTPMVDLGFLLITFFVFTTTMSLPRAMNLVMPDDKDTSRDPVCASCVLTVLLDSNNSIKYYEGDINNNTRLKETTFSPLGIRKILLEKKKMVKIARGNEDAFVLIVKPSPTSTFQNFVNILDEVAINNIRKYYIDELNDEDKKLLKGSERF